jgi:Fic family protein
MNLPVQFVAKQLVAEYAHQSVMIENNILKPGESHEMYDFLASFFDSVRMPSLSLHNLSEMAFPDVSAVNPTADKGQMIELRNHLVASQWIAEVASQNLSTSGLDEDDVRHLSAITMKVLGKDGYFLRGWGPKVRLGDYRQIPISVRSNPLAIFPYHVEVPACMRRFFEWRNAVHREKKLHPLIIACQMTVYFVHIHPFPDGNGRVSRMIMHDYLVRQGYLPVVMQDLERKDYLRMIKAAQDGHPDEFVHGVLSTQLERMTAFKMGED